MAWDLWIDFMRTDGDGLTHAAHRDLRDGFVPQVGQHLVVGNEEADPAVARVERIDDTVILVRVLPGPVADHLELLGSAPTSA